MTILNDYMVIRTSDLVKVLGDAEAFLIIAYLDENSKYGYTSVNKNEIARQLGLSRPTLRKKLRALIEAGYVESGDDKFAINYENITKSLKANPTFGPISTIDEFYTMEKNFPHMEKNFPCKNQAMEKNFPHMEKNFPHMEKNFPHMEKNFPHMEKNFPHMEKNFPHMEKNFPSNGKKFSMSKNDQELFQNSENPTFGPISTIDEFYTMEKNFPCKNQAMEKNFPHMEKNFPHMEKNFPHMEKNFPHMEKNFPHMEKNFPHMEKNFPSNGKKFSMSKNDQELFQNSENPTFGPISDDIEDEEDWEGAYEGDELEDEHEPQNDLQASFNQALRAYLGDGADDGADDGPYKGALEQEERKKKKQEKEKEPKRIKNKEIKKKEESPKGLAFGSSFEASPIPSRSIKVPVRDIKGKEGIIKEEFKNFKEGSKIRLFGFSQKGLFSKGGQSKKIFENDPERLEADQELNFQLNSQKNILGQSGAEGVKDEDELNFQLSQEKNISEPSQSFQGDEGVEEDEQQTSQSFSKNKISGEEVEPSTSQLSPKDKLEIPQLTPISQDEYYSQARNLKMRCPYFQLFEIDEMINHPELALDSPRKLFIVKLWEALREYFTWEEEDEDGNEIEKEQEIVGQPLLPAQAKRFISQAYDEVSDAIMKGEVDIDQHTVELPEGLEIFKRDELSIIVDWERVTLSTGMNYRVSKRFRDLDSEPVEQAPDVKKISREEKAKIRERDYAILRKIYEVDLEKEEEEVTDIEYAAAMFLQDYFDMDEEEGRPTPKADIPGRISSDNAGSFIPKGEYQYFKADMKKICGISPEEFESILFVEKSHPNGYLNLHSRMFDVEKMNEWNKRHKQKSNLISLD